MSLSRINNNIAAQNANRNLASTGVRLQRSIERLSSGLRINRAGDDAAGLTVAARLKAQTQGLDRAVANAQDGINMINVAEGALEETTVRLNRLRVLSIQAANTGVNDLAARKALQDEVFQAVDEVTRIAQTTQFNTNRLLNGDFKVTTDVKAGQVEAGLSVDASPVASTLESGSSYLNIVKVREQDHKLVTGDPDGGRQTFAMGVVDQADAAVSNGVFTQDNSLGSTVSADGGVIAGEYFNQVSLAIGHVIAFDGVLADGVSKFNGTLTLDAATTMDGLASAINLAISAAEQAVFGVTVDTGFNLSAHASSGRIVLEIMDGSQSFSLADLNIRVIDGNNNDLKTQVNGVSRVSTDPGGVIGFHSTLTKSGVIGNNVTAITGSTFASGQFSITVEDVQAAQQRTVKSTIAFTDQNGTVLSRTMSLGNNGFVNGRFESGIFTGAASLTATSTIALIGTNHDGTTFSREYTVGSTAAHDENNWDGMATTVSGLIRELNSRRISSGNQLSFQNAVATFAPDGTIKLIDETGRNDSEMSFTLVFNVDNGGNDSSYTNGGALTISDDSILLQEGFAEQANVKIDGGPSIRANAGDVVTLYGEDSTIEGIPTPEVTLRLGRGLVEGTDIFETVAAQFVGKLNGGAQVTFEAGDQDVQFIDGRSVGTGVARTTTIDFDNIINVTKASGGEDTGTTVILSTVNRSMNFHIGAFSNQNFRMSIGDLRADNLGFGRGSGRTLTDIDVTSLTGANSALDIIDEALDQVNRTRSLMGAATNRLEATIANLSVSSENLSASESRLRDADIAKESSEFTRNQVLQQAGTSILAQANFTSQGFLALLG